MDELERLQHNLERFTTVAKAATEGPWLSEQVGVTGRTNAVEERCIRSDHADRWVVEPSRLLTAEDADYLATFDPPTVLKLLSVIAQLGDIFEQLRKLEKIALTQRSELDRLEQGR